MTRFGIKWPEKDWYTVKPNQTKQNKTKQKRNTTKQKYFLIVSTDKNYSSSLSSKLANSTYYLDSFSLSVIASPLNMTFNVRIECVILLGQHWCVYVLIKKLLLLQYVFLSSFFSRCFVWLQMVYVPVTWSYRIHWLHLCRGVSLPIRVSWIRH